LPIFEEGNPMPDVNLAQAQTIVAAALAKAQELGVKMNIAVVDTGTHLKAFARMDGAWLGSADISIRKARTARLFDMPTGAIGQLSQPGGPLYAIEHSNGGLITFPGGVPLVNSKGEVIGAIGVSGDTVENDHAVASAGATAAK
jgi:uncharacterized protein GlcG (DUF336 family)